MQTHCDCDCGTVAASAAGPSRLECPDSKRSHEVVSGILNRLKLASARFILSNRFLSNMEEVKA